MLAFSRLVAVVLGLTLVAFGLWIAMVENEDSIGVALMGVLTALTGALLIGALIFERMRYRSLAVEPSTSPGPAGGEPPGEANDPRFRPTDEVFIDPTSGRTMRVFADPATGERRYRSVNDGPGG